MSWLRRGAMLSSPLTSLLLRAPPRVGSAPRPVAASLARGVSASIGGCARPTAATDAFSARRGFAGAAARRPARSLTTMGAATKRAGGKAKGGAGGRGKGSGAKAPAAKPTRPGRKGVGPPARRGLKNRLKDQAQKSASQIQPDWGDDDDDDDDELAAFNDDVPDVDPSSLGDFDDDDDDDDGVDGIYDDDEDDEDEDAPGAATTAGLSMDVDDAMFKFIPEEEREAAKAAYLRMAAGGGGGRSAEAGADDDDEDEDDAREVFAEEDIEDDLYLTDEADGLTQATVQQAKGAIVKSARFMQACVRVKDCPPPKHPEVAVIGRSNVGKSSLVNMLTNRKDIAKTSKNPGKTRTINHFEMITGDGTWYFVDLPGYGFANAPEEARRKWAEFTREYLLGRPNLLSVMLLIDSTVKPQRLDLECLEFLGENNIPVTVVFTKVDKKRKVKSGKRANPEENVEAFCREVSEYWDELPPMIFTSSKTGDGKQAVLNHVATLRQFFREGKKGKPKNKFLEDVLKAKEEGAGD